MLLTAEATRRGGVEVGVVGSGVARETIKIPAEVQLNPDRVAHVSPLVDGQLLTVDAALGDVVSVSDRLARLRSVELGRARADLSRATSLRGVARKTRERQERLRAEGINSEQRLLEATSAYEQADAEVAAATSKLRVFSVRGGSGPDMTIQSPLDGVIIERHATRGETVTTDDTIFVIADLSRVWIIGRVYEQQLAKAAVGMSAKVTLNAYPGRSWSGTIDYVGAALDETTRTLPVRVEVDNPDGLLKPGLFGSLTLAEGGEGGGEVAVVPSDAIQTIEGERVVFVPGREPGSFVSRRVEASRVGSLEAYVTSGLKPGERVVVRGAFVLKSELMKSQLGHGHAH